MTRALIAITFLCQFAGIAAADDLVVPADYPTIQEAMAAAGEGDVVLVLPGLYVENIDFLGKAVVLRSDQDGDPATLDLDPEGTVIDGGMLQSVVRFVNGEGPDAKVQGFTLTNGSGKAFGGGVGCDKGASPEISHNIITKNHAAGGGGISCLNGASPRIVHNRITLNKVTGPGGGIRCYQQCNAVISENVIENNKGGSKGGAIFSAFSAPIITNNVIRKNTCHHGGGVWCGGAPETAVIAGNWIAGNKATKGLAGGLGCDNSKAVIINNVIAKNSAMQAGGIYCAWTAPPITCNTVTENTAKQHGGGIWCLMSKPITTHCIFWNNTAPKGPEIHGDQGGPLTEYCDIKGGYPGQGNLDADPQFVDPGGGDFHLRFTSPCREAGTDPSPDLPDADFEGDPRAAGGKVDIGADEFYTHLYFNGKAMPGGTVQLIVTAAPDVSPVLVMVSSSLLDPPLPTGYGAWHLGLPLLCFVEMDPASAEGLSLLQHTFPQDIPVPWDLVLQALAGDTLTNLCTMKVR